jgi:hypothetical protein
MEDEMDGVCSSYGLDGKCVPNFRVKPEGKGAL